MNYQITKIPNSTRKDERFSPNYQQTAQPKIRDNFPHLEKLKSCATLQLKKSTQAKDKCTQHLTILSFAFTDKSLKAH